MCFGNHYVWIGIKMIGRARGGGRDGGAVVFGRIIRDSILGVVRGIGNRYFISLLEMRCGMVVGGAVRIIRGGVRVLVGAEITSVYTQATIYE